MKRNNLFTIFGLAVFFLGIFATPVRAEVAIFRMSLNENYPGTNIKKGACQPVSLSENLSARTVGDVGPGCEFTVEVKPMGEWVLAGGYFDTPPYSWGSDTFFDVNTGNGTGDLSYKCDASPNFSVDEGALPSYVELTNQAVTPGSGTTPPLVKYTFKVQNSASLNSTFNLKMSMDTNCQMSGQGGSYSGVMTPVDKAAVPNEAKCGYATPVNINPREFALSFPVRLSQSCLPQATNTPRPPTNTPTPRPPSCNQACDPDNNQCPQSCPICENNGNGNAVCLAPTATPRPPSCNQACDPDNNQCPQSCPLCTGNANGNDVCLAPSVTPRPTATPAPQCGDTCIPGGANNQCPINCAVCADDGSGNGVCMAPSPTPTPPPVCGGNCVADVDECPLDCPVCAPVGGGKNKCLAPSPTPTPPPVCGGSCQPGVDTCPLDCPVCADNGGANICLAPSPTPTPPPVCGGNCVPNVDTCPLDCPVCADNGGANICLAPSPTPTPPPVCGGVCVPGVDTCPLDCPICADGGSGSVCLAPTPTITPTPVPMCNTTCVAGADTCPQECPVCAPSSSGGGDVCRTQASCDCDGFTYAGDIAAGNQLTFTTFAKVGDPDNNNAEVRTIAFHVEKDGAEVANSGEVSVGTPQRTTDTDGSTIDRYSADWAYTIPADLATQSTFRAYAKITCGYKNAQVQTQSAPVLREPNFIERIIFFFMDILGIDRTQAQEIAGRVATFADPIFEAAEPASYVQPSPTPLPGEANTVKLGTFDPQVTPTPPPTLGCKQMIFSVGPR